MREGCRREAGSGANRIVMRIAISWTPFALVVLVAVSALGIGCGSDPPPTPSTPTSAPTATAPPVGATSPSTAPDACSEIAGACHEHDRKGSGATKLHECHELGHAHKLEACVARKQECLDACAGHAH